MEQLQWASAAAAEGLHIRVHHGPHTAALLPTHTGVTSACSGHITSHRYDVGTDIALKPDHINGDAVKLLIL